MRIGPISIKFAGFRASRNMGMEKERAAARERHRRIAHEMRRRHFADAELSDLYLGFKPQNASINDALKADLRMLRGRSRALCMDNDYASKFLNLVSTNIIGNQGILLQSQALGPDGTPDKKNRELVEDAWRAWGKPGVCDVSGRHSWVDIQRIATEALARDGEVLVVDYNNADNAFGYAVQIIECDRLDESMNLDLDNGNRIVMGVEQTPLGKPVAYYLLVEHPSDGARNWRGRSYERFPAERVAHIFITRRPEQSRGYPWMTSAMRRMNMLGGYEEAEWVAARVAACKMGVITTPDGASYTGDAVDADGNILSDAEPGEWRQLAAGQQFNTFDPTHPNNGYGDFVKSVLRGVASGMNVTYTGLANDLENVNFSSIRAGVLEEREQWRALQAFVANALCDRVYRVWLGHALLTGAIAVPPRRMAVLRDVQWVPRGWTWVDPIKDIEASIRAIELGVTTRTEVAASQGKDFDTIIAALAEEKKKMDALGLSTVATSSATPSGDADKKKEEED